MTQHPNPILNVLPQNIFAAVQPLLQPVELAFGDIAAETGELIERVHFPHSGVVSLVVPTPII